RIAFRLVDLGNGHNHRHVGGLSVMDGLTSLSHDAVVRGHNQNHDIGGLGAAGTHGCKRLVTRGVKACDHTAVGLHVIRADVLRDAAGLSGSNLGTSDLFPKNGLSSVNVAPHNIDSDITNIHGIPTS